MNKRIVLISFLLVLLSSFVSAEFSTNPADYLIYNLSLTTSNSHTVTGFPTHNSTYSCFINVTSVDPGTAWLWAFQDSGAVRKIGAQNANVGTEVLKKIYNDVFTGIYTSAETGMTLKTTVIEGGSGNDWLRIYDTGGVLRSDTNETITTDTNIDRYFFGNGVADTYTTSTICWNGTESQRPTTPINVSSINESTENLIVIKQIGNINIVFPQNISSIIFNTSLNVSTIYFSHVIEAESVVANQLFCKIQIDGITRSNITRNMSAFSSGNIYTVSTNVSVTNGSHTENLQCEKLSGPGAINIRKSVGVGHEMVDQFDKEISSEYFQTSNNAIDGTSFQTLNTFYFIAGNQTINSSHSRDLVLDFNYELQAGKHSQMGVRILGNGTECFTAFRSFTLVGQIGVGGGFCIIKNVSNQENISITVQGNNGVDTIGVGTQLLNNFNMFAKEFINDITETNSTNVLGNSVSNSSLSLIDSYTISNTDHSQVDLFTGIGLSILSNSTATEGHLQIRIENGVTTSSFTYDIGLEAFSGVEGGDKMVVIQEVLENAPIDDYNISLYASCDNSDCIISGGNMISYFGNIVTVEIVSFNLSVFDNFDNSTINNFTATLSTGNSFQSTTGNILINTPNALENVTITSNFNGGYFGSTILNHNTSNNLNVTLNQTFIRWNCIEKISNNNLNCSSPLETIFFNYNVIGNSHTQSINVSGYFENIETFNVTALQNNTLNSSFGSSNVSLEVIIGLGSATLDNCSYNVTSQNVTTFSEGVTGAPNSSISLINGTYNVSVDCSGFAIINKEFVVNEVSETVIITLFTTESVNFVFKDADSFLTLSGVNVTVNFIGASSFTNITSTGTLFVDLITPSVYTITASAPEYRQTQFIITVTNRSTQNVTMLLQNESNSELVLISVKDKFSGAPIKLAKVTVQKFVNNAWQTDQILNTDFQGRTEGHFVLSTVFYNFLVEFNDKTFFGIIGSCSLNSNNVSICNTDPEKKLIFTEDVSNGILVEIDTDPNEIVPTYQKTYAVSHTLNFTNTSNVTGRYRFFFINNDGFDTIGNLVVYENTVVVCNETVTSSTGTLFCNVNGSGDSNLYTAAGFINSELVQFRQDRIDDTQKFIRWGVFGWYLALLIYLASWFFMVKEPSMALPVAFGSIAALIFFEVILRGFDIGFWMILLVMAFMIIKIPKKGVV